MKRNRDITSLFQKHAAKKAAAAAVSSPPKAIAATMVEGEPQVQETIIEEIENPRPSSLPSVPSLPPPPPPPPPPPVYDINQLPHDPDQRLPIQSYPANCRVP